MNRTKYTRHTMNQLTRRPELTRELIWSAATDAGNRTMRQAGRAAWNEEDLRTAVNEFYRLAALAGIVETEREN